MSFHINAAGNAGECRAQKGGCPFGSADEHFATADQARENFEQNMAHATVSVTKTQSRFRSSGSFERGEIKVAPLSKEFINSSGAVVLPPGRYFVGDPCYTAGVDDKAWQDWCSVTDAGDGETLTGAFNGLPVVGLHTAHGDGTYFDESGREYGVDAGLIGAVPEELVKKMNLTDDDLRNSGHWVETSGPFVMSHGPNGQLNIGDVSIETDPEDEPEEEDHEQWDLEDEDEREGSIR